MPHRPRGWVLIGADEGTGIEPDAYATVRVRSTSADALVNAHRWLRSLPETRGLPIAIAGGQAALHAAAVLGPAADALVLEHEVEGPVALIPTLVLTDPGAPCVGEFLDAELSAPASALNHRQRRFLARGISRAMRGEVRGLRAAIATAASALALTVSMGLFAAPASADFTPTYDSVGNAALLTFTDAGGSNDITLDCAVTDDVVYDLGAGPTTIPGAVGGPTTHLDCIEVSSVSVVAGGGNDTVELETANATTDYTSMGLAVASSGVDIDGGPGNDDLDGMTGFENSVLGDAGGDTLSGAGLNDTLSPGTGDDSIGGQGGTRDLIDFTPDTVGGTIDLASGTTLGADSDTIAGTEDAIGTSLGDEITAVAAGSSLLGAAGSDTLNGNAGVDTLGGESGGDEIDGGGASDTLAGGTENDTIFGGTGAVTDTLDGDAGNDLLDGQTGADSVRGDTENDTLLGGDASGDTLNGEAGADFASYGGAAAGVDIDLNTDSATGAGTDTLTLIEHAIGSLQSDTIDGDASANTLLGLTGLDTINGQGGSDSLDGGDDGDALNGGGTGLDTVAGGSAPTRSTRVRLVMRAPSA